ncbi:MAG: hypothetical protein D6721_04300 [Gammaproteobacteria bacterium]|nr:MAG: hypothetical protein D6721_04300 [Gammaproteobacteria bacterium]
MPSRIRLLLSLRHQELVRRLQRLHATHPKAYLALVAAVAAGGAGLLVAPALTVFLVTVELATSGLAPVAWSTGQWLEAALGLLAGGIAFVQARLRYPVPHGVRVSTRAAPALHEEVARVRRHLRAAAVDDVIVDAQPRVALVRLPHPLLPLLHRNRLLVGAPVLATHAPDHFRVQLARALGEVSAHNLGLAAWLYRLRQSWVQYRRALARRRGGRLLARWLDVYAPFYSRLTQPLLEAAVLQGDRLAALVAEEETVAEAICREQLLEDFLEEYYWPRIRKSAERHPEPRFRPYAHLALLFRRKLGRARGLRWLREAWNHDDGTGPSLFRRRLEALGYAEPLWVPPSEETAGDRYLPQERLRAILARLDMEWMGRERDHWRLRYQTANQGRERMARLGRRLEAGRLDVREALEYAALCRKHARPEAARAAYETLLSRFPEEPRVLYAVGKYYVSVGDPHGVKLLEWAMEKDSRYVHNACSLIADFVRRNGCRDLVATYVQRRLQAREG